MSNSPELQIRPLSPDVQSKKTPHFSGSQMSGTTLDQMVIKLFQK